MWPEVQKKAKMQNEGKVYAFVPTMQPGHDRTFFRVGIAVLGQAGYTLTQISHDTFDEVANIADVMNEALPYDKDTIHAIVADTLHRSAFNRDQAAGITQVKVTADEAAYVLEAIEDSRLTIDNGDVDVDGLIDRFESAKDELQVDVNYAPAA